MAARTAVQTLQTPAEQETARRALARSIIIPWQPLSFKPKRTPLTAGRRLVDPPPKQERRGPTDNEISPHFAWTKKRDLDRASLDYWVRLPLAPYIPHSVWMSNTRSVSRTVRLIKGALKTMKLPQKQRTKQQIHDVRTAMDEYVASMYKEKGKWDLPKSTHKRYKALVEILSKLAPIWPEVPPRTAEQKAEFPSGYYPRYAPVILPKTDKWTMVETFVDIESDGEIVEGTSIGPDEILKMYEDDHDWEGLERVKKEMEGWP